MIAAIPSKRVEDVLDFDVWMLATELCDADVSLQMILCEEVTVVLRVGGCKCLDMQLNAPDPDELDRWAKALKHQKLLIWL
jgi:hypothetical protein